MLIIEYEPVAFPERFGPRLAEPDKLRCSWAELVWAAAMTGHKSLRYVIQPHTYASLELVYRSTLLYENLQAAEYRPGLWGPADTLLLQSPAYRELDPAQKAAISYILGLAVAKLFVARLIGVAWLSHAHTYEQHLEAEALPPARPDFVGFHPELGWLVMEVKGRSHWFNRRVIHKAKQRAGALADIGGQKPGLQIGLCGYFSGRDKILKVYLEDPPLEVAPASPTRLLLSGQGYLEEYYRLLLTLLASDYGPAVVPVTYGNRTYRVRHLEEADLQLGLDEQLYDLLQSPDELLPARLSQALIDLPSPPVEDEEQVAVGRDGVYVRLGPRWHPEHMALPPGEREKRK